MIQPTMKPLSLLATLFIAAGLSSCGKSGTASSGKEAYPLDVCVVSGEKLGSMGEPHVIVHEGVEVRFCCAHCLPKFEAGSAAYLAKIKAAR